MTKVLLIDVAKCYGCQSCVVQCKDEYVDNDWLPYSKAQPDRGQLWMRVAYLERGQYPKVKMHWIPTPCMHCDSPPCLAAATGGAVYKRPDGIVIIDPEKSVGQKELVDSCPYGAICYDGQKNIAQKCTLCAHLLDAGWKEPRCVKACPTAAITYGEYEDLKKTIDEKGAVPMHPEYGAKPRVYYIGLPKTFITGAVVDKKTGDCLDGVEVTAKETPTGATVITKSDAFGDFWLDGLEAKKNYDVTITSGGKTQTISVTLDTDTDLGDIRL
ncbi:4Fe-4S dicluster domain-containing protein [[Eubacterium] cellulosolvens]